jgi:thioredoxin reductase (NADPH)
MTFFTTPELLEIGDIPFPSAHQKPTRLEALEYYRKVAEHYRLKVRQYEVVESVSGTDGNFTVCTNDAHADAQRYCARKLVLATGFYDLANMLQVPGESLPKVMHYYREPHPYYDHDVLVVGGRNSAAIAALELWRHGARVTLVHRREGIRKTVKYWIKPDIENRIKNGEITANFNSFVKEIREREVVIVTPEGERVLKNDFVFALTGYHPDFEFLDKFGIKLSDNVDRRPVVNTKSLESNVPGIYLAGVIVAGMRTNEIFIENGRFHGRQIAADLRTKLQAARTAEHDPEPVIAPTHLQSAE